MAARQAHALSWLHQGAELALGLAPPHTLTSAQGACRCANIAATAGRITNRRARKVLNHNHAHPARPRRSDASRARKASTAMRNETETLRANCAPAAHHAASAAPARPPSHTRAQACLCVSWCGGEGIRRGGYTRGARVGRRNWRSGERLTPRAILEGCVARATMPLPPHTHIRAHVHG